MTQAGASKKKHINASDVICSVEHIVRTLLHGEAATLRDHELNWEPLGLASVFSVNCLPKKSTS